MCLALLVQPSSQHPAATDTPGAALHGSADASSRVTDDKSRAPIEATKAIVQRIQDETKKRFVTSPFVKVEVRIEERVEAPSGSTRKPPSPRVLMCTSWMGRDRLRTEVRSDAGALEYAVSVVEGRTREYVPQRASPISGAPPQSNVILEYDGALARIDNCTLISGCIFGDLTVSWKLPGESLADGLFRRKVLGSDLLGTEDRNGRQCMHFRNSFSSPTKGSGRIDEASDEVYIDSVTYDLVAWDRITVQSNGVRIVRSSNYSAITFHTDDSGWDWKLTNPIRSGENKRE